MSLTKAQLLGHFKPRFEWVDVNGFGKVGIRSCPAVQLSRRRAALFNGSEAIDADMQALAPVHMLIDQVMETEDAPMFSEEDAEALAEADADAIDPLFEAVYQFNGEKKALTE